jgi:hypothetical protein
VELNEIPAPDRENPLQLNYSYALTNKVSRFGNDIYVGLDWNKPFENMNMGEDRETDYYFDRKVKQKTHKKLRIPSGYKVTHLPKSMSKSHEDFTFRVSFKQTGNEVIYDSEIVVTDGVIRRDNFKLWNEYIEELKEIYNDQIVITKGK